MLSLFIICLLSLECASQSINVTLGIDIIPHIKVFPVKGHLVIRDSMVQFTPSKQGLAKPLLFPNYKIHRVYANNGPINNKIYLETDSSTYTFSTYRASRVFEELNFIGGDNERRLWEAFLMKRLFPYVLPMINDFHWLGYLSITDSCVLFQPNDCDMQTIKLQFDKIVKVRTKGYWIIFPRNVVKIKTLDGNYNFVVREPKTIKTRLQELIDS